MITTNKFGCIDITDDWQQWQQWLSSAKSFRYIPKSSNKAFTARKEQGTKGKASYWYAYRKEGGKLAKCYIGTALDLTVSNLEAISSKLTEKLQTKVTEKIPVTQSQVTEKTSVTWDLVIEKLPVTNSEVEKLQKQMEELQRQLQITLGKVDSLEAELEASRLEQKTVHPDYQAIRDNILQQWRVSKRAESKDRITLALDAFITELVGITGESTQTSTSNGTAAQGVDAAGGDIAELQRITLSCGYRLNIDRVTRGANKPIFFVTPPNTMTERIVSTLDISEIINWLRRQDLLGE